MLASDANTYASTKSASHGLVNSGNLAIYVGIILKHRAGSPLIPTLLASLALFCNTYYRPPKRNGAVEDGRETTTGARPLSTGQAVPPLHKSQPPEAAAAVRPMSRFTTPVSASAPWSPPLGTALVGPLGPSLALRSAAPDAAPETDPIQAMLNRWGQNNERLNTINAVFSVLIFLLNIAIGHLLATNASLL
ncbi:hypothetical protein CAUPRSCDRAFT_12021 [Caulochytrium protostelioides]|uniref:Uncharacterized protein n=1 Tax=Caulochytrium protostelioides TaxID=1555241 RepID=A0A4V1IT96_9FUNG|nr:hypothetical protein CAUPRSCDRAFT_12021 [Caulochytrium protostelioides]